MRLIDADELKNHISELMLVYKGTELDNEILNAIDNAPTEKSYQEGHIDGVLQAEKLYARPIGEWVMDNEHTKNPLLWYKCKLCGVYHSPTNFCPSCGADMREEAENEGSN